MGRRNISEYLCAMESQQEENPSPAKEFYINFNYQYYYSLPNYNYTLPTVTWQGQNQYSIGNPDLTKENRHDFYVWLAYHRKWTVYYDFNYGDNLVKVIMHADPDRKDTYFTRPENAGCRYSTSCRWHIRLKSLTSGTPTPR